MNSEFAIRRFCRRTTRLVVCCLMLMYCRSLQAAHPDYSCACQGIVGADVTVQLNWLIGGSEDVFLTTIARDQHNHQHVNMDPTAHTINPNDSYNTTVQYLTGGLTGGDEVTVETNCSGDYFDHNCPPDEHPLFCPPFHHGRHRHRARCYCPPCPTGCKCGPPRVAGQCLVSDFDFHCGQVHHDGLPHHYRVHHELTADVDTAAGGTKVSIYRAAFRRDSVTQKLVVLLPLSELADHTVYQNNIGAHAVPVQVHVNCSAAGADEVWLKVFAISANGTLTSRTRLQ